MPFKPGQSGNPSGRPAVVKEVRDLARTYLPDTFARLFYIAMNDVESLGTKEGPAEPVPYNVQVAAMREIHDRAIGKAIQPLEHTAALDDAAIGAGGIDHTPFELIKYMLYLMTEGKQVAEEKGGDVMEILTGVKTIDGEAETQH